ncbi:MAG: TonB-dependent receptor plug domain-containing protein [Candidatus Marinimicrobia bacterium]|nr:TonB-dependent receptor plug domain-containing protein [Candidatus Neomarinimicrobiota bacterium]MBL7009894.1 TonB-dependent receptor plug domain-containing protein [Candidatus Neomarinimicrobiota bacterium]MBL7030155.1 TonB-dependent receptor plug domain-containing protein [Candidatus Neomarinimicrobiota bacterium]
MKKIYFLQLFLFVGIGFGQEISGSIEDRITKASLNGVNITVENSDYGVSSDIQGNYTIDVSSFETDQIVKFQHIGYEELFIRIDRLSNGPNVKLNPRVLQFETIETSADKRKPTIEKDLPQTVSIIQSDAFELRGFTDAGDLLATDQSVQIEESLSGRKTISIRSGNADDVLILYNGFRLNRSFDNVFDLSLIDMQNVEQIEIVKGGHSVLYGPDAFSGVVNIVPKNAKDKWVKFSQQFGSYQSGFWNLNGQVHIGESFISVSQKRGTYRRLFEDSEVEDSGLLSSLTHISADINQKFKHHLLYGDFDMNLTEDKQSFENNRDNNTINSTNQLVGMRYSGSMGPLGEVEFGYGNHNLKEVQGLNNLAGMILRNLDHNAQKFESRKYINLNRLELMFSAQMEESLLKFWDDRNMSNITQIGLKGAHLNRSHFGIASVIKLHSKGDDVGRWMTDLDVSFRQDQVKDRKSKLVFRSDHEDENDGKAFLNFGENDWKHSIVKVSTIASKRQPNQTMGFWVTTGTNVKFPTLQHQISLTDIPSDEIIPLLPEKMKSLEIGVSIINQPVAIENVDQIEFQGSFFRNDYIDKLRLTYLLGMPVGYYENIGIADMMGFEGSFKLKLYNGHMAAEAGFSKYNVSDLSAFPFKSASKLTGSVSGNWKFISINYRWFSESEQIGWIRLPDSGFTEIELPPYSNYDMSVTLDIKAGPLKGKLSYSGRNLKKNDTTLAGLLLRDTRKYITFNLAI